MSWWHKEPGHQHPWYCPSLLECSTSSSRRVTPLLHLDSTSWNIFPRLCLDGVACMWSSGKAAGCTGIDLWHRARDPCYWCFMGSSSTSCKNNCHSYMKNNDPIKSQFCTCHDSWAVVTCANLWTDQINKIKIEANWIARKLSCELMKLFMKWVWDALKVRLMMTYSCEGGECHVIM